MKTLPCSSLPDDLKMNEGKGQVGLGEKKVTGWLGFLKTLSWIQLPSLIPES